MRVRVVGGFCRWALTLRVAALAGEQLITLERQDLQAAIKRFVTARPPTKKDPALIGGAEVLASSARARLRLPGGPSGG